MNSILLEAKVIILAMEVESALAKKDRTRRIFGVRIDEQGFVYGTNGFFLTKLAPVADKCLESLIACNAIGRRLCFIGGKLSALKKMTGFLEFEPCVKTSESDDSEKYFCYDQNVGLSIAKEEPWLPNENIIPELQDLHSLPTLGVDVDQLKHVIAGVEGQGGLVNMMFDVKHNRILLYRRQNDGTGTTVAQNFSVVMPVKLDVIDYSKILK